MTISITKEKTETIVTKMRSFLENKSPTIRELASVIGDDDARDYTEITKST